MTSKPTLQLRRLRALGASALMAALLLPTVAQASVVCAMTGQRYQERCPCPHEGSSAGGDEAAIAAECCATQHFESATVAKAPTEQRAPTQATVFQTTAPRPALPPVTSMVVSARVLRALRPPPTGPPVYIAFNRYLS